MMVMVALGLLTICNDPDIAQQSVPTIFMVQKGVGAAFMRRSDGRISEDLRF